MIIQQNPVMFHLIAFFFLPECSIGLYGVNCLQTRNMTCGIPGNCDRITGYCNGGCQRGWIGVRCEEGKRYTSVRIYTYLVQITHLYINR